MLEISKRQYDEYKAQGKEKQLRRSKHKYYYITDQHVKPIAGLPRPKFIREDIY